MNITEYPCPACGFLVNDEPPGSYNICCVCGWEDDHVQLRFPALAGGANKLSLYAHQQNHLKVSLAEMQIPKGVNRDKTWRPLRPDEAITPDAPRSGIDYFHAATDDSPSYYWL